MAIAMITEDKKTMALKKQLACGIAGALMTISATTFSQELLVNFRDTDIKEVIGFVSEITGKTIVVDPMVKGRVMVVSEDALSPDELYELFLSVLDVHNFVAIESGGIVRVVPKNETRTASIPVTVAGRGGKNDSWSAALVTQVIPVTNVSAVQLLPVLRPLVPQESHLAAYEPSNSIVITDTAANAERIRQLVAAFDNNALGESEVIPLRHAGAEAMAELVKKVLLGDGENTKGLKVANVVADSRANRLLVSGDLLSRKRVRQLVQRLDSPVMAESSSRVLVLQYADAKSIATALQNIASQLGGEGTTKVDVDEQTNSLMLSGEPSALSTLTSLASQLDTPRTQVLVEAIIVELQEGAEKELGVQWLFANTDSGVYGSSANSGSQANIGAITGGIVGDGSGDPDVPGLGQALSSVNGQTIGIGGISGDVNFNVLINALQDNTGANILSTPSVMTVDNREASISVGQNVPFVTGSYTSQGSGSNPNNPFQTIQREEVGIKLTVTPRVNDQDRIMLDIEQEVSSLSGTASVDASDIITNTRNIATQIMANNGEIVVLGGLIQDDVQSYEQKVPLLGDIPIMGHLFRSEGNRVVKTNLVVFIRATILDEPGKVRDASMHRYEDIRNSQLDLPPLTPQFLDKQKQPVITDAPANPLVERD